MLANGERYQRENALLEDSFNDFARAAGYHGYPNFAYLASEGGGYDQEHPEGPISSLFKILTESYYQNDRKVTDTIGGAGHPWNNANELFASSATVMRFHTDDFIAEFNALQGTEREAVRLAARSTLAAFYEQAETYEEMVRLFPRFEDLADALGYSHVIKTAERSE